MKQLLQLQTWQIHSFGVGLCLVAMLAVYWLAYEPARQARADQHDMAAVLTKQEAQARQYEQNLTQLEAEIRLIRQKLEENPTRLEPAERINTRLAAVTALAEQSGLRLEQVQPGVAQPDTFYNLLPIDMQGQASYQELTRFLNALHDQFTDMAVKWFDLTGSATEATGRARLQLQLMWYTQPTQTSE